LRPECAPRLLQSEKKESNSAGSRVLLLANEVIFHVKISQLTIPQGFAVIALGNHVSLAKVSNP
jgi:hypothetical protein